MGYSEQDLYNPPKPEQAYFDRVRDDFVIGVKRRKQKVYNFIKRLMIRAGISD